MTTNPLHGRYLNSREAARFLGGRSLRWLRSHLNEIPHLRLYGQLLFDPMEIKQWVIRTAECRETHVDVVAIVEKISRGPRTSSDPDVISSSADQTGGKLHGKP